MNYIKQRKAKLTARRLAAGDAETKHDPKNGQFTGSGGSGGSSSGGSGAHKYNPESVNKAIESSNRSGRRIGGSEAKLIHRLLKGRH